MNHDHIGSQPCNWGFLQALHPEDRDRYYSQKQQVINQGQSYEIAYRLLAADGNYYWFTEQATPVQGEDGEVQWVVSCTPQAQNQSDSEAKIEQTSQEASLLAIGNQLKDELLLRQLARTQAEAAQQRFRELVNGLIDVIVWECDPVTFEFSFVSESATKILGYAVEQWSTPNFWVNLIHPDERELVVNFCREERRSGRDHEFEYRCITANGEVVWLRDRAYVVRDPQGKIQKLRGLMIDITKSKQAQEELRESEARFHSMADTAPVMIWISGTDALYNWFNKPWLDFTGRTLESEISYGWTEGIHPEDLSNYLDTYITAFNARQPFKIEHRLRHLDGKYYWILNHGVPRFTPNGSFVGYIGSCIDITERKAAEEAQKTRADELTYLTAVLAQTNIILEKRNQELDQFAYVASHDLKAPLRAIANLSEWIEEDIAEHLNADTQHQMNLLRGRVHRMEALINGLLQYSRVGRIGTTKTTVSVAELLTDIIDSLAPPETFTIEVASNLPTFITERLPLEQVFTNLISNAIKHHPRLDGKIKISVQDQKSFYEFAVSDDGAGIAPQYHEKVFGIFQTLEARDKIENTGIGLAIVKKIVERQGGTIRLESQAGQGATFYFTWLKVDIKK